VPILPDDTAAQVFDKVTVAAEQTLWRVLPALLAGTRRACQRSREGSYFGGRKPEDGRIDWSKPAAQVYNLCAPWRRLIRARSPTSAAALRDRARASRRPAARRDGAANLPAGLHVAIMRYSASAAMAAPYPFSSCGSSATAAKPS
jgi:methionyl-tRNA formyltransferase